MITADHSAEEYRYRKVTSSPTEAGRKKEKVDPNPDKKRKKPMGKYILYYAPAESF
jgi:hypothetical protein